MDWNDIRYFLAVAETRSLAGATRRLKVNHSTVFRRINALETRLQVRLFDRLPQGYHLTEQGEAILDQARHADAAMHEIERRVAGGDVRLSGHVRVTTAPNLAVDYLAPLLPAFGKRYPEISVEIAVGDNDYDLSRREADIALRATPSPPDFLVGRRVARLTWFAMASEDYLSKHGAPTTESGLADHRLIGADHHLSHLRVFAWQRQQFSSAIHHAASDLMTMAAIARAGAGIALLPSDQHPESLKRLFRVCPEGDSELWLLTHPDLRHAARVKALMGFLHQALAEDRRLQWRAGT